MRIGLDLEKNYQECFREQFLARTSLDITFVMLAAEDGMDTCDYIITDCPQRGNEFQSKTIHLVENEPETKLQICKLQRFSFVYAQIMHCIVSKQKAFVAETMPVICVLCPGSEEKRNAISLALSSCLAEKWEHIAYMSTEGIDINDSILDSPQDEGFTKLFLNLNKQAAITNFSYQHTHQFYFLGSARSRKDKRFIGQDGYRLMLQRLRQERAFDYLVIEMSQELDETEMWLMSNAEAIVCIRGSGIYEVVKWEETLKRLSKENPSLAKKSVYLAFGQAEKEWSTNLGIPDVADCFPVEEIEDFYKETSIGIEFDPGKKLVKRLQPFVDYILERMMS